MIAATAILPTTQRYAHATGKLGEAQDAVERLSLDVGRIADAGEDGGAVRVTAADIGELWSLIDYVETDMWALKQSVERMRSSLGRLNNARLEKATS